MYSEVVVQSRQAIIAADTKELAVLLGKPKNDRVLVGQTDEKRELHSMDDVLIDNGPLI